MTRIETSSSWYDWAVTVSCSNSQIQKYEAIIEVKKNLEDEARYVASIDSKEPELREEHAKTMVKFKERCTNQIKAHRNKTR